MAYEALQKAKALIPKKENVEKVRALFTRKTTIEKPEQKPIHETKTFGSPKKFNRPLPKSPQRGCC